QCTRLGAGSSIDEPGGTGGCAYQGPAPSLSAFYVRIADDGVAQFDTVAAIALGLVKRCISQFQHSTVVAGMDGPVRQTNRNRNRRTRGTIGFANQNAQSLSQLQRLIYILIGQENTEFLPPDTTDQVCITGAGSHGVSQKAQHQIAHIVSVSVVDALEVVYIHGQHGKGRVRFLPL